MKEKDKKKLDIDWSEVKLEDLTDADVEAMQALLSERRRRQLEEIQARQMRELRERYRKFRRRLAQ